MAVNEVRYVGNVFGAPGPLKFPGRFKAGATQAIKRGEILELDAGDFVPLDADQAMAGTIAVADAELRVGDLAGYHDLIVPRPGDVFEADLLAASNPSPGADLFWSDSQTLKVAGTNVLATVADETMLPKQGFQSVSPSFDAGTTIPSRGAVRFSFKASVSFFADLFA